MKVYMVFLFALAFVGCAAGNQDPNPSPTKKDMANDGGSSLGTNNHTCDPNPNGALCQQYRQRDPEDFSPGEVVYQYNITCSFAATTGCKPWALDPDVYTEDTWAYCCDKLIDQDIK